MNVYTSLQEVPRDSHTVLTVGTFDGMHLGHQTIVQEVVSRARKANARAVVITFEPHPRQVIHGDQVPLLTTTQEKIDLLAPSGIDALVVVPFTKVFSGLTPEAFVEQVLVGQVGLSEMIVGYDHGFGSGRQGGADMLMRAGCDHGFSVDVVPPLSIGEQTVSSSGIRTRLEEGNVADAATMLGRLYVLRGIVERGDERGRTLGYPTANIGQLSPGKITPANGVYAVLVDVKDGPMSLPGMMNLGLRPTFDGLQRTLEVHLIGFEGDLYNAHLDIAFVDRIRDEQRFGSVQELVAQLDQDRANCIRILNAVS